MIEIILKCGTYYEPTQEEIIKWQRLYPSVDVEQELRAMVGWCDANPSKRKTKRGVNRFINSWLTRAQTSGGSPQAQSLPNSTRHMTMDQMFSRDWAKS